jgi:hypothetical protein
MTASQDFPLFAGLAVAFTLLFLVSLRSLLTILPSLVSSIFRWKRELEIEDSLQLSRSRNLVALTLMIPTCMLAYSYNLYSPEILNGLTPLMRLAAVTGVMLLYLAARAFLNWQLEMHNYGTKVFNAANNSFYNYSIILFFLLFMAGAVVKSLTGDQEFTKTVLQWIAGVSFGLHVIRRGQIFMSACNPFTTFLYLCGLELLPTTILVLSAVLL